MAHTINLLAPRDVISARWTRRLRMILDYAVQSAPENIRRIKRSLLVHSL